MFQIKLNGDLRATRFDDTSFLVGGHMKVINVFFKWNAPWYSLQKSINLFVLKNH